MGGATARSAWWLTAAVSVLVACQAPAPAAPPPTAVQPTAVRPTAAPTSPATAVPPTAAPTSPPTVVAATAAPAPAPATSASRVDVLNAASQALGHGDAPMAAALYERVVNTPPAANEGDAASTVTGFAHFRALVALLADSREDQARTHLEALQASNPSAPLARLGAQLYDQYGMTGQLRGACAQLQPQIESQAGPTIAALRGLGVNVEAQTLCSVPQI